MNEPRYLLKGRTVLLAQRSANRDGSAISGLMVASALVSEGAHVQVVFGHDGPVIEDYLSEGCLIEVVPHGDWLRPANFIRSARRIHRERVIANRLLRDYLGLNVSLIYVNSIVSYSFALLAQHLRVPCIWHLRELFSDMGGEMVAPSCGGKWLVRREIGRLSKIIVANSKVVAQSLCGKSLENRVKIVPNAVAEREVNDCPGDGDVFRRSINVPPGSFIIGLPGTMRPVKGHRFFIESFKQVLEDQPKVIAVFLGDTSSSFGQEVVSSVEKLGLRSQVRFAGEVTRMNDFYAACDIVCVPSQSESFGRTVIEAFFARTPVVATSVGGLTEIIEHGKNGLLVPYGDVTCLAAAISSLMRSHDSRLCLIENAWRSAMEKFTEPEYRSKVIAVAQQALELN